MSASGEIRLIGSEFGAARRRFGGIWKSSNAWFRGRYRDNAEQRLVTPIDLEGSRLESDIEALAGAAAAAERMLA